MLLAALMLHAPPRAAQPSMNFFDDAATWLRSVGADYEADALSPAATEALADITRPDGWRLKCEIGSEVAQRLGGSGTLATGPVSSTAALDLRVAFGLDEGYAPPQGPVRLLQRSRYLEEVGFWKVDADADDGMPEQVQFRLQVRAEDGGLVLGGTTLVPPGPLYFNAIYSPQDARGGGGLERGRVTVKEDIGTNAIFQARGILAEFKIVGAFDATRMPPKT